MQWRRGRGARAAGVDLGRVNRARHGLFAMLGATLSELEVTFTMPSIQGHSQCAAPPAAQPLCLALAHRLSHCQEYHGHDGITLTDLL